MPFPPEWLIKGTSEVTEHRLSDHVAKLIKVQSLLIEIARDNQLSADSFHMKEASPLSDMFPVNSYVLLKPPDGSREKLQMPKAGPYIVVEISGDKYSIQDLLTHKVTDTHVSNLFELGYDSSSGLDPIEVAARNAGEFFIDRIYENRGTTTKRLNMEFLVSWKVALLQPKSASNTKELLSALAAAETAQRTSNFTEDVTSVSSRPVYMPVAHLETQISRIHILDI